jgi:6-phosphogluconolactonase
VLATVGCGVFHFAMSKPAVFPLFAATALLLLPTTRGAVEPAVRSSLAFVGTYTGAKSQGIYVFRFDPATGDVTPLGLAAATDNPSFLAVHPNGRFLYAVNETGNFQGKPAGSVTAFAIERATGRLRQLNQTSTLGGGPCHLIVDRAGKFVIVANYGGGSVAVLPIRADGTVGTASAFVQHHGSSVNRQRQEAPHAHGATLSPDEHFLFVPDLGLDRLVRYRFNRADGTLTPGDPPFTALKPGSGPRHLVFAPDGRHAYIISELVSTVTEFTANAATGGLTEQAGFPLLPADFQGQSTAAEVAVHPNGRFLYASNRGHDSLAVFAVGQSGALQLIERVPSGGRTPRHFALDPTGRWLWAANQDSNELVVFRVDANTGRLEPTGRKLEVGAPVCVCFLELDATGL